jgi:transcriptional regulator with XRE-family HTH domain
VTETPQLQRPVGAQLRGWREHRRLSQMDLALRAEVSTRHLSFIETGRSRPSREMILRLAGQMELPTCERNHLLLSGGYAPVYSQSAPNSPDMTAARAAIGRLLVSHEPYPAVVVDRSWNLVDSNSSVELLTEGTASWLLEPPANTVRIGLHPDGMAPRILNLDEWHGGRTGHRVIPPR